MSSLYNVAMLQRAIACDPAALLMIVQRYNGYINRLSQRPSLGNDGMIHLYIDEDLKQELVLELLMKIPRFKIPDQNNRKNKAMSGE